MRCPSWCDRILFKLNSPLYQRPLEDQDEEKFQEEVIVTLLRLTLPLPLTLPSSLFLTLPSLHSLHGLPLPRLLILRRNKLILAILVEEEHINESLVRYNGLEVSLISMVPVILARSLPSFLLISSLICLAWLCLTWFALAWHQIKLHLYDRCENNISDHKPVKAIFTIPTKRLHSSHLISSHLC